MDKIRCFKVLLVLVVLMVVKFYEKTNRKNIISIIDQINEFTSSSSSSSYLLSKTTDEIIETSNLIESNNSSTTIGNRTSFESTKPRRKNVLFIIVDDLRAQLGPYFDPDHPDYFSKVKIQTPNLDKFASESMVFKHAYAQYSLCGPSRTSLFTSRRPDVTQIYNNRRYWREVGGNFTTLPQYLKNNGYLTVGLGKVFHPKNSSNNNDPLSWTEPYFVPPSVDIGLLPHGRSQAWLPVSDSEMEFTELVDISTTKMAKVLLKKLSENFKIAGQPFFMAVGYHRPHRSMICPERYYQMYPLEEKNNFLANKSWQEPRIRQSVQIDGVTTTDGRRYLPSDKLRSVRRAYFACISYIDNLVGEILQRLKELDLAKNTIVSFISDHGFHLGENGEYAKTLTTEVANRIPLIIRIPGVTDNGMISSTIVEAVDVFPTIVEAAGLDSVPLCPTKNTNVRLCTQGKSMMPIFHNSSHVIKDEAFSQVKRGTGMSYTIRTKEFRLVDLAIREKGDVSLTWPPDTNYTELYDHRNDIVEQVNLVDHPDYKDIINNLRQRLHKFVMNQIQ